MVECTGLENQRTARYRGFESLSLRQKQLKTSVLRWFFLCLYANEACFSERKSIKRTGRRRRTGFQMFLERLPLKGSFERSEKNPSHQSDWDQVYSWLLSFKQEDVSLQEQFVQPELRFILRRFSAPSFNADFSSNQPDLLNITSRGV